MSFCCLKYCFFGIVLFLFFVFRGWYCFLFCFCFCLFDVFVLGVEEGGGLVVVIKKVDIV